MAQVHWEPPAALSKEQLVSISERVLALPAYPVVDREDVFRIHVLGLNWDIACQVVEPADPSRIPVGPDGKKAGMLVIHGGGGDHRQKIPMARFIAGRFGYKVVCPSYPGRFNFHSPDRKWPEDSVHADGTLRTPIYEIGKDIGPDQYDVVRDRSKPYLRKHNGTYVFAAAKEGTEFYDRMAAWPIAFEEAMMTLCKRHFPADEWSIYAHGHSTGGPFTHMTLQRVENVVGLIGCETTPFGIIYGKFGQPHLPWPYPFNYLHMRTWRDRAGYLGPELGKDGIWEKGLAWVMEDVLDAWEKQKEFANFKAEEPVHYGCLDLLENAARVTAKRLGMNEAETLALIKRFQDIPRPLSGPGVKPVPPILWGIAKGSRDHRPERYLNIAIPAMQALDPAPKLRLTMYGAGVHGYEKPEEGLPEGLLPAVVDLWHQAIMNGYYLPQA